ncbi:MAG: isoprenoid biosynthesis glyoxalase ElbB [Rickettsiaceae bacterium H1]|nr:isoprenoid biosynthesis glyoxalase ElbB [Rickettsiaceae bacterium H1]
MVKIAVILSGCGHLDGSEIRESVLTLLSLDKAKAEIQCFAPDKNLSVKNHLTDENQEEKRNILVESARIARGKIKDLTKMQEKDFAGIILPGGFGAAQNLSDLAINKKNTQVIPQLKNLLIDFWQVKKPIGAICIAPAIITAALSGYTSPEVTIGEDKNNLITNLGGKHKNCTADNYYFDQKNNIFSSPAYMLDAPLHKIARGIDSMVNAFIKKTSG